MSTHTADCCTGATETLDILDDASLAKLHIAPVPAEPTSKRRRIARESKSSDFIDGEFLRGRIPLAWLARACRLPGQSSLVALAIWFLVGLRGRKDNLNLTSATMRRFNADRFLKTRALKSLEKVGLIKVERNERRNPVVTILDDDDPGEFLRGPIPLAWLSRACALPGHTVSVALAVWFLAGLRDRKTNLKLTTATVERFNIDRSLKTRALKALEGAGLIKVERNGRKNPIVTILDVAKASAGKVLAQPQSPGPSMPPPLSDQAHA